MKNKSLIISSIITLILAMALNLSKIMYMDDSTALNLVVTIIFIMIWCKFFIDGFRTNSKGFVKYSLMYWLLSVVNFAIILIAYAVQTLFSILMIPGTILSLLFSTPLYGFSYLMAKPFSPVTYSWLMLGVSAIFLIVSIGGIISMKTKDADDDNDEDDFDDFDDDF